MQQALLRKPSARALERARAAPQRVRPSRRLSHQGLLQRKCACGGGCPNCKAEAGIQTKLAISEPGDAFELEADRVADQVMRMPMPTETASAENGHETSLQRRAADTVSTPSVPAGVPPIVHDVLRSPGQPLDAATRAFMEPRFGQDFSHVRVHTDANAAQSARAVNAVAYTVGSNIVFGTGRYAPGTQACNRLLAHELTHVRQQRNNTLHRKNESESEEEDEDDPVHDGKEKGTKKKSKPARMRKRVRWDVFSGGGLPSMFGGSKAKYTHHRNWPHGRRHPPKQTATPCNPIVLNITFQWQTNLATPVNKASMDAQIANIASNWQPCNTSIQIVINSPACPTALSPLPAWFVNVMNNRAAIIQNALILNGIPAGAFLPASLNYCQPGIQNAQVVMQ